MKRPLLTQTKAQSTMEYIFIATLVMAGIIVMGPYVIRGINAPFKIMDDSVKDSFSEDLTQADPEDGYDFPCRCELTNQCGSSSMGADCDELHMTSTYNCNPPDCMKKPVECKEDSSCCLGEDLCCVGWVASDTCGSCYTTPSGTACCLPTQRLYRRECGTGPGLPDPNYKYSCQDNNSCILCSALVPHADKWCPNSDRDLAANVSSTYVDYGTIEDPAANCDAPSMNTKCQGYCKYPYIPSTDHDYCVCQSNLAKLATVTVTRADGTTDPNAANIIDENVSTMAGSSPLCADHPWSLNADLPFPQSAANGIQVVATLNYGHNDPTKGTRRIRIYTKNAAGAETLRWDNDITTIPQVQWGDYGIEQLTGGAFRITVMKPAAQTWDIAGVRVYAEVEKDNSTNECALPGQTAPLTKSILLHEVSVWSNACPTGYTKNSDCSCTLSDRHYFFCCANFGEIGLTYRSEVPFGRDVSPQAINTFNAAAQAACSYYSGSVSCKNGKGILSIKGWGGTVACSGSTCTVIGGYPHVCVVFDCQ
jgi:hypothetical protein